VQYSGLPQENYFVLRQIWQTDARDVLACPVEWGTMFLILV
jgi:hypothetical protein